MRALKIGAAVAAGAAVIVVLYGRFRKRPA